MVDRILVTDTSLQEEVLEGLRQQQKKIPSKYFYDERGSKLFEKITRLKEYYLTRTETSILENNISEITDAIGRNAVLIEPGSGSSRKTRILLDALPPIAAYIPVDISDEYLQQVAVQLKKDYPSLPIHPVCADYTSYFELPDLKISYGKQVIFFPGSTIGNFTPERARSFLETLAALTGNNASMLIGIDLKKEKSVLEAAYNDSSGVTAKFNKNMLRRLNRELGANFDPDSFHHSAFYNETEGRIEMHLVSCREQKVRVNGEAFYFEKGESIHTENSYKYSPREFEELVADWYRVKNIWVDKNRLFSIQYVEKL